MDSLNLKNEILHQQDIINEIVNDIKRSSSELFLWGSRNSIKITQIDYLTDIISEIKLVITAEPERLIPDNIYPFIARCQLAHALFESQKALTLLTLQSLFTVPIPWCISWHKR